MTGTRTTDGQIVSLRLTLADWAKFAGIVVLFVTGPLIAGAWAWWEINDQVGDNATQIAANKQANERTAESLADVTRLVDRISGRLEAAE